MPIYEYQCAGCGRVTEKWQKISEAPLKECPDCGGSLTKLVSSCSFQLKGSGWYVTDYAGRKRLRAQDNGDGAKPGVRRRRRRSRRHRPRPRQRLLPKNSSEGPVNPSRAGEKESHSWRISRVL